MYALSDHIRRKMSRRVMGRLRMTMACVELELSKTLDDEDGGERNAPGFQRLTGEDMQVVMVTLAVKRRMRRCGGLKSTEGRKEGAGGVRAKPSQLRSFSTQQDSHGGLYLLYLYLGV
jgi:hypothetical protein